MQINFNDAMFNRVSDEFKEEVEKYIAMHQISIKTYQLKETLDIISISVEPTSSRSKFIVFTYNKNNEDYGLLRMSYNTYKLLQESDNQN